MSATRFEPAHGAFVVVLDGDFDMATEVDVPLDGRPIVVDASGVTFAGSTFLTWLLRARDLSDGLILVRPSECVQHLFQLVGMDDEFAIQT